MLSFDTDEEYFIFESFVNTVRRVLLVSSTVQASEIKVSQDVE